MYTLEQRTRAVELYIKHGLKATTTIGELGYPSRVQLAAWHREWLETGGSLHERSRAAEAYSAEQKRAAVGHHLEHGRRNACTRRELGYPKSYQKLADWIEEPAPGERRTTEPRTFTLEQRQRAAAALVGRAGSAREIAGEAGSSRCTLYRWKRELLGEGPDMAEAKHDAPAQGAGDGDGKAVRATQADIDALEARKRELVEELRRLEPGRDVMEGALELLGKGAGADPANEPANREKTLLVESLRPKWGLSELLRALGMARSSHQCQLKAMRSPDRDAEAREMVCAAFDANDGTYGRRRTRDELKAQGHVVGERRIRRIMAEERLEARGKAKPKRGHGSYEGEVSEHPSNKVGQDFEAGLPNFLWLTDATQFSIPAGKLCLSPVLDCFDGANATGAQMPRAIHAMESREASEAKALAVADELERMWPGEAAKVVREGCAETLAYTRFPQEHWRRIRTNNAIERINREIRRRTRVVGTFPDGRSALMLVTARLKYVAESEWGSRRYLDVSLLHEYPSRTAGHPPIVKCARSLTLPVATDMDSFLITSCIHGL